MKLLVKQYTFLWSAVHKMLFEIDSSLAGTQHRPKKLSVFQRAKRGLERFCLDFCQCWRGMSTWLAKKFPSRSKRIDVVARILFPLVFAIFNLSYWTFYLLQHESSKFNWFVFLENKIFILPFYSNNFTKCFRELNPFSTQLKLTYV